MENKNKTEEEKVGKLLICPNCKMAYEFGMVCLKCGSTLEAQTPSQNKEEFKSPDITEVKEEFPHVAPPKKQSTGEPVRRLFCPSCKILYERGNSCIRCGSSLVTQTPSQEKEEPKISHTTEVQGEEPKISDIPEVKKEELKAEPIPKVDKKPPPIQTPEQRPVNRLPSDIMRWMTRRLSIELVSIIILISVASGYFIFSMYSYFMKKAHKPGVPPSKEIVSSAPFSSSSPTSPTASVSEPQEIKNRQTGERSSISKETNASVPPKPSIPDTSQPPFTEIQEVENIKNLLENIRQANLKKNIDLFISCYSTNFKDREEKKRTTLESWKNLNYLNLSYHLKSHSIYGNIAHARVVWLIRISPKTGGQPQEGKTVLDVIFEKEEEGWKIKEIKTRLEFQKL